MGFRRRLVLFLVVTLITVQAITALLALGVLRHNSIEQGRRALTTSTAVFMRQLDLLSERVGDEVNVLALDYALRQAIADGDRDTILSALRNHGRRVGATRMLLVNLNGTIEEDTTRAGDSGKPFPLAELIKSAAANGQATTLASISDSIYWIIAVPVKAPVPIAFIAACVPIDNALLDRLRDLSSFPNSVALATPFGSAWRVVASTDGYSPIIHAPASHTGETGSEVVEPAGGPALTLTTPLKTAPESAPIIAVLDYPLHAALQTYRDVIVSMLIVLAGSLVLGLVGALVIARGVSRPIETLAAAARRIAGGDYSPAAAVNGHGEIGALSSALAHMTAAIKQREDALKRTLLEVGIARDEAVRANEAKSQFLANMSHELRTPLNAILGFSEMMVGEVMGPIGNPRYAVYARDINDSGKHLLGLVEEMLDLARVEAGKMEIGHETLFIGDVLDSSLKMLGSVAQKAGVALRIEGDPATWPAICGDARKLVQAITNLVHNGIKFTPQGGRVTISAKFTSDALELRVADTGIGMRAEDIPTVVKPFQRLASAFDGKYQGAGLGLPFAKAVVELHGGSLHIDSAPGAGTTVTIKLPLADTIDNRKSSVA